MILALLLQAAISEPMTVAAEPFPGLETPRMVGCLTLDAGLTVTGGEGFGGYSDLSVDAKGGTARLISDAGHALDLSLTIEDGTLRGVGDARLVPMVDCEGETLGKRSGGDAEGLAFLGNAYAVSFEGRNRIALLNPDGTLGPASPAPREDRRILGKNSGFEALALLPDGDLLAISEGTDADGLALVRRGRIGTPLAEWALTRYRPAEDFAVTSARIDPATGDLLVLERAFSPLRGPRARIARVPADRLTGEVLEGRQLARMGFLEGVDNMEGLDLHRGEDGRLTLYLVSDDNFSAAQRTVLMTLSLRPGCDASGEAP